MDRKRLRPAVLALVALMLSSSAVFADNLNDTLASGSVANPTIAEGAAFSATIQYQVQKTGSNNTSFPATVDFALTSGAPAWVSMNVASRTFAGYSDVQSVTVSGTAPAGSAGVYGFSVLPTTSANNLNPSPATLAMTITVEAPADSTPPVISPNVSGTLGNNDWYTSDVTVTWSVVDNESAISSSSGCDSTTISADTIGITLTCSATSAGGTSSQSVTIKRDATAPTISGSASPAANGAGWNKTDVSVTFTCADATSGVASCGPNATLSGEGAGQSVTGAAMDNAGNSASATVSGINIDKTAPTVALVGGPADGSSHYFGSVPDQPTCTASDALSGLAGACAVSGYGTTVGSHTVTASATDNADNTGSASASYSVLAWTLYGFYSPVDMGGTVNTVKGGSTVPLKFEVFAGPTELTDTSIVSTLAKQVTCNPTSEDTVEVLATGGTSLRYDTTSGQFIFNWQTPKLPGKCYDVTVTTADGSSITAAFKLK